MHYADKLFGVFQRLHSADEFEGTGSVWPTYGELSRVTAGENAGGRQSRRGSDFYFTLPNTGKE
jgi:light-regulated signal transduction histidine kinase (bacteriophytochrome)